MSNARQGWNAAQLANERRSVKRKALAPVGVEERPQWDDSCPACGYHNCSSTCIGPERHAVAEHLAKSKPFPLCSGPCCVASTGSEALRSIYDSPIRFGEPEPALLTYDQAVAACRAGAVLQITGGVQEAAEEWIGTCIRFGALSKRFESNLGGSWFNCSLEDNGIQFRICP